MFDQEIIFLLFNGAKFQEINAVLLFLLIRLALLKCFRIKSSLRTGGWATVFPLDKIPAVPEHFNYRSAGSNICHHQGVYFVTSTVVDWIDVFTRDIYRDILLDSIRFCQKNQNLQLHAGMLMPNHFHLICSFINNASPGMVIKNIKSFPAMKLIECHHKQFAGKLEGMDA